ncbi:MAG: type IV toxin-antitoxin system AbiEi family antitoxin domain-containing protein [Endomicrobia bacterium]|nr:type IV toxin-antitoxin system AbiEi family antitoxin domain-containing protein [Bacillota bacterium]MCL1972207.1 type IV toxin-antitoxin system AbiEi family antitoxin domain-containing protein [Endomicrobiia bacterium]
MDKLKSLLKKNDGILTASEANAVGISNERLRLLVKDGSLERVAHGVYASRDVLLDKMYIFQKRRPKLIYSHETALFLHNLTDRDPINYSVTVPRGYNNKSLIKDGLTVFSLKSDLYKKNIVTMETVFGHKVYVYGLERTICDCIRSRNQMDIAVVTQALKQYSKRKDKNISLLMRIAGEFEITKILRGYMEVLL